MNFNASIIINESIQNGNVYTIKGKIVDKSGWFYATDVKVGNIIYMLNSFDNVLLRYTVTKINSATGMNINADVEWDSKGSEVEPMLGLTTIIGDRNEKSNTIVLTSASINIIEESLMTAIKNYEQILIDDYIDSKENDLNNPIVDDQILSSKKDGTREWINIPVKSVNSKHGDVVLTTEDVTEKTNLYFTEERVKTSPTIVEMEQRLDDAGDMKKQIYDSNGDNVVDIAHTANSIDWQNVQNKPVLSTVATSGSYNDLKDKPIIPTLPTLATVATTGDYDDLENKPVLSTVATSGSYNDLKDKPVIPTLPTLATVATSGSYNDLKDKPIIPSKVSELQLDDVYTKQETNTKVSSLINDTQKSTTTTYSSTKIEQVIASASGGSSVSVKRYIIGDGSVVTATGDGVTITKSANVATINCPNGVHILTAAVKFSDTEMSGKTNCTINLASKADGSGTGNNESFDNFMLPSCQVFNNMGTDGVTFKNTSFSFGATPKIINATGLQSGIGVIFKLVF